MPRAGSRNRLNVQSALLAVGGDKLGSLGVIAAGLVVLATGWNSDELIDSMRIDSGIVPWTGKLQLRAVNGLR
jgi:cobalt-zinc-cadmium efflux system protein